MCLRAYAHGAHDGSFRACGSAGRARHMGSVCVRSREMQMGVCLTLAPGASSERGGRDAALGINQSVSQIILAHHDSRINHDSTHRESACAATDPAGTGSADTVRVAMTTDAQAPRDVACSIARLDTTHFTGRIHWVGRTRRCSGTEDTEKPARSPEPCAVVAATPPARPARAQAVTTDRGGSAARPRAAVRAARAAPREVFSLRHARPQRCRACPSKCAAAGRLRRLQGDRRHE